MNTSSEQTSGGALNAAQLRIISAVIALSFVFSGVLGLLRGVIIGAVFGAGSLLDAFYAAYRLPEMLFTLVAGGALGSAFIPIFNRFLSNGDESAAWRVARATLTCVTLIATFISLITAIFAFPIVDRLLIPAADPAQKLLTADLMRIMLITVAIFSASGLLMAILNANQRFLAPALAPSMNNIGLMAGALLLSPSMGIYGLAWGAVVGAILHLAVQLPALRAYRGQLRPSLDLRAAGLGEILRLMLPRLIGAAAVQLNFVVNTILASDMTDGSLSALSVAFTLMFVVLGVVAQSAGTAIFPTLSTFAARGETENFRNTLAGALRGVLFISLPATVGLILLSQPLIATLFERGEWDAFDTTATAWALSFFALGLAAFSLQELLARAFYALRDTLTPVAIAVGGMILNVALSLSLISVVRGEVAGQGPHGGLALANALATMIESAILWVLLRRKIGSLHDNVVLMATFKAALASVGMGLVVWLALEILPSNLVLIRVLIGSAVGLVSFGVIALLLGLPEARSIPQGILRRLRR
ncbi:MAG: murein biosynthesis integral membrane protein MurJ [Anaerolineae bacterium]